MASSVEHTPEGIIYTPATALDVPDVDLATLLFDSEWYPAPEDQIIHADAADPSLHLTKARLRQLSKRAAHVFRHQYGIGAGGPNKDVVSFISTGHFMLSTIFYGAIMAGGIVSPSSPFATTNEFAYQLTQTKAKVVLCSPDLEDIALAAAKKVGLGEKAVLVFGGTKDLEFREAASGAVVPVSNQELDWERITDPVELQNSVICIVFSSGTTSLPKAMCLSHQNCVACCKLTLGPTREYNRTNSPPGFEHRSLAHLPTAHIAGVVLYFFNPLLQGGVCYWMTRYDFPKLLQYTKKYRISFMFSVPPIWLLIAKSNLVADQFDSLGDSSSAAAPMGRELQAKVSQMLGKGAAPVRQSWGLSETTGVITNVPNKLAHEAPLGSVGALIANCYARIVDDNDEDVQPGEPGEIWVKGPVVTKGYWRNEKANEEAFKDGWFRTGDIGVFRDGWFFIVDRKKELIKYKGNQVAPAELEAVLLSHPKVIDAAVIGVPGDGTEVPRAYIVADPKQITGNEIVEWFSKQGLSHHKRLRGGVVFIEAIPKSASGKILRKELRNLAKQEISPSKL